MSISLLYYILDFDNLFCGVLKDSNAHFNFLADDAKLSCNPRDAFIIGGILADCDSQRRLQVGIFYFMISYMICILMYTYSVGFDFQCLCQRKNQLSQ